MLIVASCCNCSASPTDLTSRSPLLSQPLTVALFDPPSWIGVPGFLDDLRGRLKAGTFRPLPVLPHAPLRAVPAAARQLRRSPDLPCGVPHRRSPAAEPEPPVVDEARRAATTGVGHRVVVNWQAGHAEMVA